MYLNCKTYFSFRYGTISTAELISTAVDKGISSLALTNINSTCDTWEFVKLSQEAGIKPIVGAEIRNDDKLLYILIAANNKGLAWINSFLSEHLIDKKLFPETASFFENKSDGFVIYPLFAKSLPELTSNEVIGILPWELNKLITLDYKKYKDKLVVRQPVTFQNKTYFNLHRLLRAISKNCLLSKLPPEAQASEKETFVSPSQLIKSFEQYSFIITNTYKLMDACSITSLIPNEALTRYSFRANTESQVNKIFRIGTNLAFIRDETPDNSGALILTNLARMLPLSVNKQSDGSWGTVTGGQINSTLGEGNPVRAEEQGGSSNIDANRFLGSVTGLLHPIEGLEINGIFSYNFTNQVSSVFNNYEDPLIDFFTKVPLPGTGQVSSLTDTWTNSSTLLSQIYGSYEKRYHNNYGKILFGTSYESDESGTISAYRDDFPSNALTAISAGAQNADLNNSGSSNQRVLESYFGRANYSFMNKYILEFDMRADASSQFAPGHRWGYFPSLLAAWNISDESFMKNISWVNNLKLRASWGNLGNLSNVGYYDYLDLLTVSTVAVLNGAPSTGVYPTSASNPNLTWEVVESKNIGLDGDLFNHKLNFQVDAFNKLTKNILLQLPQPQEFGYQTSPSTNAGKVDNKGIEVQLAHNGSIGKLQYTISGNMTKIWNKVVDLDGQDNQISGYYIYKQGQSIGSFYMLKAEGLFKDSTELKSSPFQSAATEPGDIKYADLSGPAGKPDDIINSYDRTIVGNDVPYFNYGFGLNLRYKNFDFLALGQGVLNVKVYLEDEASQAFFNGAGVKEYVEGRWTTQNPNPNAVYPRLLLTANNEQNLQESSFWLFNADYFRFKTISLGYTLPSSIINPHIIKSLRLYFSSNNAFTIRADHRLKDFDPEAPSSRVAFPQLKTYSFGVNLNF